MKRIVFSTLAAWLLAGVSYAQSPGDNQGNMPAAQNPSPSQQQAPDAQSAPSSHSAPAAQNPSTSAATPGSSSGAQENRIAPGTIIPAELAKSIDAKKAKPGDPVVAKITQDLLSNGQVVIPRGSKITGHVTQASGGKKGEQSTLGIAFDKLIKKDGTEVPLQAAIQAIAKPQQSAALSSGGNEPMSESSGVPGAASPSGGYGGMNRNPTSAPGNTAPPDASAPHGDVNDGSPAPSQGGTLSPSSQGAVGMSGVSLSADQQGTVITSTSRNLKLDGGTQLILRTI